jgi:hypothetical protein
MKNSEKFFTKLAEYKSARLEYEISIGKYQFSYDDVEIRQIELDKRIRRYIRNVKWRAYKARIFEFFDNRRYLRALNLTAEARSLRTIARPAIIDRSKVTLLALLERRNEINDELLDLYKKRNQDYLDAEKKNSELNVRLRARKRAFDKLYDIEQKVEQYAFTADEREDVYRRMNALVDMDVDVKILKYKEKQAPKGERELYKEAIKAKKDMMAKMEDDLVALVEKAHRRTYIDDKRHVWIWILGVAAVAGLLIILFGVFSEQITEFIGRGGKINWGIVPVMTESVVKALNIDYVSNRLFSTMQGLILAGVPEKHVYNSALVSIQGDVDNLPIIFAEKAIILSTQLAKRIPIKT